MNNETKHTKMWCDPPSGWKFGFPKIYDRNEYPDFYKWIVEEGYPQSEIDSYDGQFYCRFWEVDEGES